MPRLENVFQVTELKMFVSIGSNYVKVCVPLRFLAAINGSGFVGGAENCF